MKYQIMLTAEDGVYVLDETWNILEALRILADLKPNYGDGQRLWIKELDV
jgi:hypothetical protein